MQTAYLGALSESELETLYTAQTKYLNELWRARAKGDAVAAERIPAVRETIQAISASLDRFIVREVLVRR